MNEELNNKITEQNQKVESLETILKEIATENKANKEKEKNREKIVVEAYRQSKDTAKNVTTVKEEINKLSQTQGETQQQLMEIMKELRTMRTAMRENPVASIKTPHQITQPDTIMGPPLFSNRDQGSI